MTSNSYPPHVFSLHIFYSLFILFFFNEQHPQPTPLTVSSSSSSISVTLLFPQCFASAWPCNWKKPKSSEGGFSCPAGDGIMVDYYPQLRSVRKDHRAERWTQSSCHRSHQITQNQAWSRKYRASESNTQRCTQRCPLELLFTLTGASHTIRAFVCFCLGSFTDLFFFFDEIKSTPITEYN